MREISSYWFDVQKRANFKQLCCATCRFHHSYLTYVQFAAGIISYFLFHGIKLLDILMISCLVSIVKYNNNNYKSIMQKYTLFVFRNMNLFLKTPVIHFCQY